MNKSPTSIEPERRPVPAPRSARKSVLVLSAIAGIAAIAVLILAAHRNSNDRPVDTRPNTETQQTTYAAPAAIEPVAPMPAVVSSTTPGPIQPDRAAAARELVKRLSEIEMQPGGITPESAAKWNRDLESLVEQGTAAVPTLDEFFQSKVDVRFDTGTTNLLGEPSLRMAFIEVLFNIPTPDNVDLQERILRETSDPAEVALLARQLEAQEPGKYKGLIVYAAQTALDQANHGQWPGRDTQPLLKILNNYGAIRK